VSEATLRVAVAQMTSIPDADANLASMKAAIARAAAEGARLVAFPENALFMGPEQARLAAAQPVDGAWIEQLREACATHAVAASVGSFAERTPDASRTANTSVFIASNGDLLGGYRKIHLFDVQVARDTVHRESDSVEAGPWSPTVVEWEGWRFGLSICYDLRFPELYRELSEQGAEVIMVPAAFTVRTGMAHWHTLLRARAIENLCYVVAAAQSGVHFGERETYGHSLVVSPWGEVIAESESGPGLFVRDLQKERVRAARAAIPALQHRRDPRASGLGSNQAK
jgi:predicted amidohydrolase